LRVRALRVQRTDTPLFEECVYDEGNRETDLEVKYALFSEHFRDFENKSVRLPEDIRQGKTRF
jgi:hypothetical protein